MKRDDALWKGLIEDLADDFRTIEDRTGDNRDDRLGPVRHIGVGEAIAGHAGVDPVAGADARADHGDQLIRCGRIAGEQLVVPAQLAVANHRPSQLNATPETFPLWPISTASE